MLKLKIGQNFLMSYYNNDYRELFDEAVPYMMGCFSGKNQLALLSPLGINETEATEIRKSLEAMHQNTIYLLNSINILHIKQLCDKNDFNRTLKLKQNEIKNAITSIQLRLPDVKIKVININSCMSSPKYKAANLLYASLQNDESSILSVLPKLEIYKIMSQRYKNIPNEIKIVDNDIKKLNKTSHTCDRLDTVESLKYLRLIEKAEKYGANLRVYLKPLPIYPSEDLGLVFGESDFRDNPYLFKAASYIYQGCHFGMGETIMDIDTSFRLHFVQTIDNRFDNMFYKHNWSGVGYPHCGNRGFCAGEFNDTMAHGREYGLGYYFTSLKQYLTTANMRDTAGVKVIWYPIYDNDNNLIYCAGLDALIEECIKYDDNSLYKKLQTLNWEEKANLLKDYKFNDSRVMHYSAGNLSYYYNGKEDNFLKVCERENIDLYNKIMEGMK